MDPGSWALVIGAVVAAAATGVSTASQAAAAKSNAKAADWEAEAIQNQTLQAQADERQRNKELLSKQTAAAAASGVATTSGSPLENALSSAFEGEMNVLKIGYGGKIQTAAQRYQAGLSRAQGSSAIAGGVLKGISQGVSAYGSFGGSATPSAPSATGGSSLLSSYGNQYGVWSPSRYRL